jgi:hypothetical protein
MTRPILPHAVYQQGSDWLPPPWPARVVWPTTVAVAFLLTLGWVFRTDDPTPGLSDRGWLTLLAAVVVLVLLCIHRAAGPRRLTRVLAEYATAALLAVLLVTAAAAQAQPGDLAGDQAPARQHAGRPGLRGGRGLQRAGLEPARHPLHR